ncbi:alpha/beta hydrolase [Nocardia cyriacigeorgica]|uniref:Alpha/beta hydrolase n=3 Tax=Nocardia cyriacigeorgica TaxID=135487 RepID=A0A6P1D8M7_9NOCA|nr:alpha/beta hydrolase [Nocardia cyriacigeorgica]NEW38633.1 alpha/beta hydrolase [Nocardia cyriacigeorgica]NEW45280.1 alpha/beta hydrolase [Nocardia cyriacigeorgica]NEW49656.1 alpha/beta hydrolase [Nocardia cyriacigeorgica]
MITAPSPSPRRSPGSARTIAAATLTLLLTMLNAACSTTTAREVPPYAAATHADPEFDTTFRHEFADVDGVRMHYVTGGSGSPVVLIHGWPQTWYGWWKIMPELAEHHTVYAVDLPGLGDSTGSPTGYDKATLARYVHTLIAEQLGIDDANVVGHDFGAAVAYQYATQFPTDTARLGYLDLPLPGPGVDAPTYRSMSWHIAFHAQRRVPEAVVGDDVREYLTLFYPQVAYGGTAFGGNSDHSPFSDAEIDEYARTYSRPEVLAGGFGLYRALDQDVRDTVSAAPTQVPALLMSAQGQIDGIAATAASRITNIVRAVDVPNAGHWLIEENPQFVTAELLRFLGE